MDIVEFSIDELQALQGTVNITHVLQLSFLYGSDEAFHALCSLVSLGKDLASPSKRAKRNARIDLYCKLVSMHVPGEQKKEKIVNKCVTYAQFAVSLQSMSERWSSQYLFDELLSLGFILDKEGSGVISFQCLSVFMDDVEHAKRSNPSYPDDALSALYDSRREAMCKPVLAALVSEQLRNKLLYLGAMACQFQMQPLTALTELLEVEPDAFNESVIGFLIQLTSTVNGGIRESLAVQELSLNSNNHNNNSANHSHPPSSQPTSPRSTIESTAAGGGDSNTATLIPVPTIAGVDTVTATPAVEESIVQVVASENSYIPIVPIIENGGNLNVETQAAATGTASNKIPERFVVYCMH